MPSTLYSSVLKHIASHGFLIVGVWNPIGIIDPDYKAKELERVCKKKRKTFIYMNIYIIFKKIKKWTYYRRRQVVDWVEGNLENRLRKDARVSLDHSRSTLACQSAGCRIAVSFLSEQGCRNFRSLVMISPVDGMDPFGIIQRFVIQPGEKVPFTIPSLTIATGLDPVPGASQLFNRMPIRC